MNLGYIITVLRNRLKDNNEDTDGYYSDSELTVCINEALSWFARILKEYRISEVKTLNTANTVSVDLPDNAFECEICNASTGTKYMSLLKRTEQDVIDMYPAEGYSGDPRYFFEKNNKIYIYPYKANTTYNLTLYCYGAKKLEESDDTIDWFKEDYMPAFLDACEMYARRTRPTVDLNANTISMLYQNINSFFNEKGHILPQQAGAV